MEIERKYLVREFPSSVNVCIPKRIHQGYISFEPEVRVRSLGAQHFLTIKGEGCLTRTEFEIEISSKTFLELSNRIEGHMITKDRYFIPLPNDYMAELDVYVTPVTGLSTVEVEFESEEAADTFIAPWWFGRDVTFDKDFKNKNIARGKL